MYATGQNSDSHCCTEWVCQRASCQMMFLSLVRHIHTQALPLHVRTTVRNALTENLFEMCVLLQQCVKTIVCDGKPPGRDLRERKNVVDTIPRSADDAGSSCPWGVPGRGNTAVQ